MRFSQAERKFFALNLKGWVLNCSKVVKDKMKHAKIFIIMNFISKILATAEAVSFPVAMLSTCVVTYFQSLTSAGRSPTLLSTCHARVPTFLLRWDGRSR
jgi:hypothetical protein